MTPKKLRSDLLKKLKITQQGLSYRVQGVKRKWPMTTEEATYCIAHLAGLKLDKYLPKETIDKARGLLAHITSLSPGQQADKSQQKTVVKTRQVSVGGSITIADPILPEKVLNEAHDMAEKVYPMLYIFENSVREVIQRMMTKEHGKVWWQRCNLSSTIRNRVLQRKQREEREAWHGKRGAHEIFYTDIDDLVSLVQNNWEYFRKIFPRQAWFENIVRCMELSRNTAAHMNPLKKHDTDRVRINLVDWQNMIKGKIGKAGFLP